MYNLPYHKESDERLVKEFLTQYPFAFLSGCDENNRPVATQVPLVYEETEGRIRLVGHLMKGTDHHKALSANPNVLAVFTGRHIYVSGSWYSNPHTPSTWNYMSVHVKGRIRFLDDLELDDVLRRTSLHFEDQNEESPTVFDNLPEAFKEKARPMIVGFEVEVEDIDTVFKLSQDRDEKSYQNIIDKLREQGHDGRVIAAEMEARQAHLFETNNNNGEV